MNPLVSRLRLSGIVREVGGYLMESNKTIRNPLGWPPSGPHPPVPSPKSWGRGN
jgi:hypothetical protein